MKVILQKPVDKLGNPGDVAEVADGYARNYLIPRGIAIKAEKGALKQAETLKRAHYSRLTKQKGEYEAIASKLISAGPVRIEARAGEEGKLFGSVTAIQIAEALAAKGVEVDRRKIVLDEPIKEVGEHSVPLRLRKDVVAQIKLKVVAAE